MKYLKKTKMHELAKKIFTLDCDVKLKDCEYKFYRGSEWLRLNDNTYCYEIYASHGGRFLSVETFIYDDDFNRIEVSRKVLNGFGKMELAV